MLENNQSTISTDSQYFYIAFIPTDNSSQLIVYLHLFGLCTMYMYLSMRLSLYVPEYAAVPGYRQRKHHVAQFLLLPPRTLVTPVTQYLM